MNMIFSTKITSIAVGTEAPQSEEATMPFQCLMRDAHDGAVDRAWDSKSITKSGSIICPGSCISATQRTEWLDKFTEDGVEAQCCIQPAISVQ